jgi:hypothetical protein
MTPDSQIGKKKKEKDKNSNKIDQKYGKNDFKMTPDSQI